MGNFFKGYEEFPLAPKKVKREAYYIVKVGQMYVTNKSIASGNLGLSSMKDNASRWNLDPTPQRDADVKYNHEVEQEVIAFLRGVQEQGVSDVKVMYREEFYEESEKEVGLVAGMIDGTGLRLREKE